MGIKVEDWLNWQIEEFRRHPHDDCILWPFSKTKFGHGKFGRNGKTTYVHRAAFEKYHHRPLKGVGRHTCDTPPCFNPLHVIDGNYQDNARDMLNSGRHLGTSFRKLAVSDVKEIVELLDLGLSHETIATRFGVTRAAVTQINTGLRWNHITGRRTRLPRPAARSDQ